MKTGIYLFSFILFLSSYLYPDQQNITEAIHYDVFNCPSNQDPLLLPQVGIVSKTNPSGNNTSDGSIHLEFTFDDDYTQTKEIEFSTNGGPFSGNKEEVELGTHEISLLAVGVYHIKARYVGETCSVDVGTVKLIVGPCSTTDLSSNPPNILFIVADDFGLEAAPLAFIDPSNSANNLPTFEYLPKYLNSDSPDDKAAMPVLQDLIKNGLIFDNAWSTPFCAPTRAAMITGRHGFRTGVLNIPSHNTLREDEITIQRYIDNDVNNEFDVYQQAVIGKWHLNNEVDLSMMPGQNYPATLGIPYFDGLLKGSTNDYHAWKRQITIKDAGLDPSINPHHIANNTSYQYVTTALTDASLQWIEAQGVNPWHLWLTHIAPHGPFHKPPNHLHTRDALDSTDENDRDYYIAMLESLDKEIGRLLNNMCQNVKDNTIIIFISDNGTPKDMRVKS